MRGTLHCELSVNFRAPGEARRTLRDWLSSRNWPEEEQDELILAVSEAVTNAVEHAYHAGQDGVVTLEAAEIADGDNARRVVLTVIDDGCWRPPPIEPGNRGWGLPMMRATTHAVELDLTSAGTRVNMTSRPVQREEHSASNGAPNGPSGVLPLLLMRLTSANRF